MIEECTKRYSESQPPGLITLRYTLLGGGGIFKYEIINHTENVSLGEFMVMPNHIHGILILNSNNVVANVETLHATSLLGETIIH
ncbi:MAG: hypothetical protein K9I34_06720 [Bacteroidales bacterium]|nr:hypothetical protein [Bacteroidales bacterium]